MIHLQQPVSSGWLPALPAEASAKPSENGVQAKNDNATDHLGLAASSS